ncbi:MAG: TIGR03560 family F420-dependent LLM class oxidoreductase [Candidatus Binatia bacterium]
MPRMVAAATPPASTLRFGVQTHPERTSFKDILQIWQDADTLGLDTAFVFDHFIPIQGEQSGPCFEGWTLLSALASHTQRVRVGVLVTGNTYRYPAVLAKMAATVDHVSGGRLILGMGAGWFEADHTAYGIPFYTAGRRARRLVESVQVVKQLFTQPKSTFAGKYYQLKDAPFAPKSVQQPHPPILIGGMGPKVIQPLAARHADIWNFFVQDGDPQSTQRICAQFDAICRQVGRNPAEVEKSTNVRPQQLRATEMRDRIAALAKAGVQHFILSLEPPFDRDVVRRFALEVAAPLREKRTGTPQQSRSNQ